MEFWHPKVAWRAEGNTLPYRCIRITAAATLFVFSRSKRFTRVSVESTEGEIYKQRPTRPRRRPRIEACFTEDEEEDDDDRLAALFLQR